MTVCRAGFSGLTITNSYSFNVKIREESMTIPSNEVPRYSRDMSGELPSNLVNERVTLTSVNRTDFNIILPRCAPFFHDSVKLRKIETNEILEFGKDFYIGAEAGFGYKGVLNLVAGYRF